MRKYGIIIAAALFTGLVSCNRAEVSGVFAESPASGHFVVKGMSAGKLASTDTVAVSKDGSFSFKLPVKRGCPEFFYLYKDDTKLASLLLSAGDRVRVECDTVGNWTVEGSEDCSMLRENEKSLAAVSSVSELTVRQYVDYCRKMTTWVLSNSHSLSVVPVLFSKIGDTPVFAQPSDGVIIGALADSLETVYPKSGYISVLRSEAESRMKMLAMDGKLGQAVEATYPELVLPDINGKNLSLTSSAGRLTLLVFWDETKPAHKMYNLEVLKPLYEKYSARGFEIYSVNVGGDKTSWASVVKGQGQEWKNVCDLSGRALLYYGVNELPSAFLLTDDSLEKMQNLSLAGLSSKVEILLK